MLYERTLQACNRLYSSPHTDRQFIEQLDGPGLTGCVTKQAQSAIQLQASRAISTTFSSCIVAERPRAQGSMRSRPPVHFCTSDVAYQRRAETRFFFVGAGA